VEKPLELAGETGASESKCELEGLGDAKIERELKRGRDTTLYCKGSSQQSEKEGKGNLSFKTISGKGEIHRNPIIEIELEETKSFSRKIKKPSREKEAVIWISHK